MARPYVGEIRILAASFPPAGWMFCEGQVLPVAGYETLFGVIGATYGGDGTETFALPDLRGRLPVHQGNGFALAASGGVEEVTLAVDEMPAHSHGVRAALEGGTASHPAGMLLARATGTDLYGAEGPYAEMSPQATSSAGGGEGHSNLQPYRCLHFAISLFGSDPTPL